MRMIMKVKCPNETFNTMVRKGTIEATMKRVLETIKPEAAYFTEYDGHRCAILIVDVANSWDVPRLAEPWFLAMNAEVQFQICMTPEDLGRSDLNSLGSAWA